MRCSRLSGPLSHPSLPYSSLHFPFISHLAGVVQQQNAAVPRPRRRCDSVHPLHSFQSRSKPQKTGTGLLIRFGEAATASGRTILSAESEVRNAECRGLNLFLSDSATHSVFRSPVP